MLVGNLIHDVLRGGWQSGRAVLISTWGSMGQAFLLHLPMGAERLNLVGCMAGWAVTSCGHLWPRNINSLWSPLGGLQLAELLSGTLVSSNGWLCMVGLDRSSQQVAAGLTFADLD